MKISILSILTMLMSVSSCQDDKSTNPCKHVINRAWGPSQTPIKGNYCAIMLDGFDTSIDVVKKFNTIGKETIAYTSVGTVEPWRPDSKSFSNEMVVRKYNDFGEKWINPRKWELVKPIIYKRFKLFKSKGFKSVEIDNIDLVGNVKGADNTNVYNYAVWLSRISHQIGLRIYLKNTSYLCDKLVNYFDGVITEQADIYPYDINGYKHFVNSGKPWWDFEYTPVRNKQQLKIASSVYRTQNSEWKKVNL